MLKVFRDNLKYLSWVLWLVIFVFILFVFVDFGGTVNRGTLPSEAAATVGGLEISYREFEQRYRQTEDAYRKAFQGEFDRERAQQMGLPMQVLDQLVNERILMLEADRMGLAVSPQEVREAVLEMPSLQQDGKFIGREAYERLLRANRISVDQFHEEIRRGLLTDKVRKVLAQSVYVSPEEVEQAYRDQSETAKIHYVAVPADRFDSVGEPAADVLGSYYEAHQEDFRLPERRVVDVLTVSPAELRDTITLEDGEARRVYDEHPDDYTIDDQVRARHILLRTGSERSLEQARRELEAAKARIEGGEDFATVASEISEDPGTRDAGGELGFFSRGEMIGPFEDAAFSASPGDIVGPVETDFGVHLIQVEERREAGRQPFDEVRAAIEARLVGERAEAMAEKKANEIADRVEREGLDAAGMAALAQEETGVSFRTTDAFGRDDNVEGIGRGTPFSITAFELAAGASSAPMRTSHGWAILRTAEIEPPRVPQLDEVRDRVADAWRTEERMSRARELAGELLAAARGGEDLAAAAEAHDLTAEEAGPFGRRGTVQGLGNAPALAEAALKLDAGALGGPVRVGDSVVVFHVDERTAFDPAAFQEARSATLERLENERLSELLGTMLAERRQELDLRLAPNLLETFGSVGG
ncbi:MAG: SurA N-terminal domain-containing protein [Thermoanaerobaculia bacterium]